MKNLRWTILAALLLAAPSVVQAQDAAATTTTSSPESGTVSNASGATTTTTTTTANPGIPMENSAMTDETTATSQTTRLGNTGGEPLLMSLAGMSLAMGAFFLRRRVSA